MQNVQNVYVNYKYDIYHSFPDIADKLYSTDKLSNEEVYNIIINMVRAEIDANHTEVFPVTTMRSILFNYTIADNYINILCTLDNMYIYTYGYEGIKLTNELYIIVLPEYKCRKQTILIVNDNIVVAGGIIYNNTIIWNKQIRLDNTHYMEVDNLPNPNLLTDKIMSNIILNDILT